MDDDGSHTLNEEEFMKGINETGLKVSSQEGKDLFQIFDSDKSGTIDYNEFLENIRVRYKAFYYIYRT